jgi:predicted transcriptional regulator
MSKSVQTQNELTDQEKILYRELDKGINDMENGHTVPHVEAMKQIRERINSYGI